MVGAPLAKAASVVELFGEIPGVSAPDRRERGGRGGWHW